MKSSASPVVVALAFIALAAFLGYFGYKTLGARNAPREDLNVTMDPKALMDASPQDVERMKKEFQQAQKQRGITPK